MWPYDRNTPFPYSWVWVIGLLPHPNSMSSCIVADLPLHKIYTISQNPPPWNFYDATCVIPPLGWTPLPPFHPFAFSGIFRVNCFIQEQLIGFQVLLHNLHPHSMRASWWSPVVSSKGKLLGICFIWHSRSVAEHRAWTIAKRSSCLLSSSPHHSADSYQLLQAPLIVSISLVCISLGFILANNCGY